MKETFRSKDFWRFIITCQVIEIAGRKAVNAERYASFALISVRILTIRTLPNFADTFLIEARYCPAGLQAYAHSIKGA